MKFVDIDFYTDSERNTMYGFDSTHFSLVYYFTSDEDEPRRTVKCRIKKTNDTHTNDTKINLCKCILNAINRFKIIIFI